PLPPGAAPPRLRQAGRGPPRGAQGAGGGAPVPRRPPAPARPDRTRPAAPNPPRGPTAMTRRRLVLGALPIVLAVAPGGAPGQRGRPRRMTPFGDGDERNGVPNWTVDERFKHDVFTFVRVEFDSSYGSGYGYGRRGWGGGWATDFPDSDLNFSYRL